MKDRPDTDFTRTRYGRIARIYRLLEKIYFADVTGRSRNCFIQKIGKNAKSALVVASGNGDFGVQFASLNRPLRLALNDTSAEMLRLSQARIREVAPEIPLILHECDVMRLDTAEKYDCIAVNYFLSMFSTPRRVPLIRKIVELLSPQGVLLIADFSRPANPLLLPLFHLNWWLNVLVFWILTNTRPNLLGDMEADLTSNGLRIVEKKNFLGGLFAALLLKPSADGR